jgi:hypothetical protein
MIDDIIIATFRLMTNTNQFSVKLDRIERIILTLMENKERLLEDDTDLILDLKSNIFLNKKYITKIDVNKDVYINLSKQEANNYLKSNPKLSFAIYNALKIASYNYKLENSFPFEAKLIYDSPNNTYHLYYSNTGDKVIENKLYTDGELELITVEPRIIEVNNATYSFNVIENNHEFNQVIIYTTILNTEFFDFILDELKKLSLHDEGYKKIGKEPRIYQKLRN